MNVYYIDPTYVKPEGWEPLLTYLKVKSAYSFIPKAELPTELLSIIKPYLKACYNGQDIKKFSDNCTYWLRAHLEKHLKLIPYEFEAIEEIPFVERKEFSSKSAFNNIKNLDDSNCLILMRLDSTYSYRGWIKAPETIIDELNGDSLPIYLSRYCLNLLKKYHKHSKYTEQSSFICFDKFFSKAYYYIHKYRRWQEYDLHFKDGQTVNFIWAINKNINLNSPESFPIKEIEGKRKFTLLRTVNGEKEYQQFVEDANKVYDEYEERERIEACAFGESDQEYTKRVREEFWKECGDSSSNLDSWDGWG